MIIQSDQDITREVAQYSREYIVAEQIRKLIENERFKIYSTFDHGTEFGISLEYDVYGYGHLAHDINSFLEGCICQMKLPDDLYMKYNYTAYDWINPTSTKSEIKRSSFNVEIMDPEHVEYMSWDKAIFPGHDFHLKFKITGERIPNGSNMYNGSFMLRIQSYNQGSAREVVNILKEMLNV